MTRAFLVLVGFIFMMSACTQRVACPAYQSSFIYDKETLRQKFSYFKEDSTPKIYTASKSKYLIAVPESYRKKYRRMQTVEMKPVYPKIPDSLKVKEDPDMQLAELDEAADSAALATKKVEPGDSAYAITKTKEKFNLDQDLYMWYFREMLVMPDVRAAMEGNSKKEKEDEAKDATEEKKGGGLRGLFKKKDKTDSTSTGSTTDPKKNVTGVNGPEQPKKKGGFFKKKDKSTDQPVKKAEPKKDPKKKEDGDGF
ncbi:MAG: hypothetical protein WDN75_10595 [Bacteroidota bacterium]